MPTEQLRNPHNGSPIQVQRKPDHTHPRALWENPIEAAAFLQIETEEATNDGQKKGQTTGT